MLSVTFFAVSLLCVSLQKPLDNVTIFISFILFRVPYKLVNILSQIITVLKESSFTIFDVSAVTYLATAPERNTECKYGGPLDRCLGRAA